MTVLLEYYLNVLVIITNKYVGPCTNGVQMVLSNLNSYATYPSSVFKMNDCDKD